MAQGNNAKVVSINTEVETMTPEQLKARFDVLLAQQKEFNALKSKMETMNAGRIDDLRYEIFYNRKLAEPYQQAEKEAYLELVSISSGNNKVKFSAKEKEKYDARFSSDKKAGKFGK
jgi:hypothetical protein